MLGGVNGTNPKIPTKYQMILAATGRILNRIIKNVIGWSNYLRLPKETPDAKLGVFLENKLETINCSIFWRLPNA